MPQRKAFYELKNSKIQKKAENKNKPETSKVKPETIVKRKCAKMVKYISDNIRETLSLTKHWKVH